MYKLSYNRTRHTCPTNAPESFYLDKFYWRAQSTRVINSFIVLTRKKKKKRPKRNKDKNAQTVKIFRKHLEAVKWISGSER